jgi:small-conductance mechanosensitive channel
VKAFAEWLAGTSPSVAIQVHEWVIPTLQSVHIVAIGVVLSSVLMIDLRLFGWAGRDQTLSQTVARFGPWLSWALGLLLVTGAGMIVGEPVRELLALSFWLKMALVLVGTAVAVVFRRSVKWQALRWEISLADRGGIRVLAVVTLLIWLCVVVMGRLIAYDHVWGAWSEWMKA